MSNFKELYNEGKYDVERYEALMKATNGDWNTWDAKEKSAYIKKYTWDSKLMKLVKRKKSDEEMKMPSEPKTNTEIKEKPQNVDMNKSAEEQKKKEIKLKKDRIGKIKKDVDELDKISNKLKNTADDDTKSQDHDLDVRILAAIQKSKGEPE